MADKNDPDIALMLRVKDGDLSAYEALVEKFKQPVMNLVYRLIHDIDEAEDISQNVFVQVWKTRERYEPNSKFTTWLFTIARNLGLNEIRRRTRHPADSLDEPHPENDSQPRHDGGEIDHFPWARCSQNAAQTVSKIRRMAEKMIFRQNFFVTSVFKKGR